jgi:hypothetical protein
MVSPEIHAIRYGLKLTSELGPAGIPLCGIAEVDSRIPYSSSKIRSMSDIYDCLRGSSETQRSRAPHRHSPPRAGGGGGPGKSRRRVHCKIGMRMRMRMRASNVRIVNEEM